MYLAWFDADRKKPVTEKIAEARERYLAKFGAEPAVCLVNPADAVPGTPVELRPAAYISRNCFWIGVDEQAAPRPAPAEEPAAPAAPPTVPAAAAAELAQREDPAPTRRPRRSPKPAQPLGVLTSKPAGPGNKPAQSAPRAATSRRTVEEAHVAATPVAPTGLGPKRRKGATAEAGRAIPPARPTRDGGKSSTTAPAARRAPRQAGVTAAVATAETRAAGRKPARTTEPTVPAVPTTHKSSKGKRQPSSSVMQSRTDATPARATGRGKATKPAAKDRPAQAAEAPKSRPAKPRRLAEVAKSPAATKAVGAKPPTAARPRREQPAA